jgi:hypothetical protein
MFVGFAAYLLSASCSLTPTSERVMGWNHVALLIQQQLNNQGLVQTVHSRIDRIGARRLAHRLSMYTWDAILLRITTASLNPLRYLTLQPGLAWAANRSLCRTPGRKLVRAAVDVMGMPEDPRFPADPLRL